MSYSSFEGGSPIDGSRDDWACWFDTVVVVGDRLVVGDTWCVRPEEVVLLQLID